MGRVGRLERCGAKYTEHFDRAEDLRRRGSLSGPYVNVDTPYGRGLRFHTSSGGYYSPGPEEAIGAGSFTMMARFRTDSRNNYPIVAYPDGGYMTSGIAYAVVDITTHHMIATIDDSSNSASVTGTTDCDDGEWHHVALVCNRTTQLLTLYVDGVSEGTPASTAAVGALTHLQYYQVLFSAVGGDYLEVVDNTVFYLALSAAEVLSVANGSVWATELSLTHEYGMSTVNPPDLAPFATAVNGTGSGIVASTDIIRGPFGGMATDYNGTDEKTTMGDVGSVRTIEMIVKPATTTEELLLLSTGNDIMVSGGTVTYTGVTASATYVDGVATTTLAAGRWQHLVCVLSAAHAAATFQVATDGTNFGEITVDNVRTYSAALTNLQAADRYAAARGGA